jgi:hypothetical protein
MGTNAVAPRLPVTHQLPYFRATVEFDTYQIGTAGKVPLGTLPAGAIVTGMLVKVTEAFNAATTNVLTVGTASDDDAIIGAADVDETTVGTTVTFAAVGYKATAATPLFIKYAQTGTAATAGAADIVLWFVPDNDR